MKLLCCPPLLYMASVTNHPLGMLLSTCSHIYRVCTCMQICKLSVASAHMRGKTLQPALLALPEYSVEQPAASGNRGTVRRSTNYKRQASITIVLNMLAQRFNRTTR